MVPHNFVRANTALELSQHHNIGQQFCSNTALELTQLHNMGAT